MSENPVTHNTFVLEKSYPHAAAKVWAAFATAEKKKRWFAEGDHELKEYTLEFKVGGAERLHYRFKEGHPVAGMEILNEGVYLDIDQEKRLLSASTMRLGGKTVSATLLTVEFAATAAGTTLTLTHQGAFVEWADGPMMLEMGWKALLEKVAQELGAA